MHLNTAGRGCHVVLPGEVWTLGGLVTCYVLFFIHLHYVLKKIEKHHNECRPLYSTWWMRFLVIPVRKCAL